MAGGHHGGVGADIPRSWRLRGVHPSSPVPRMDHQDTLDSIPHNRLRGVFLCQFVFRLKVPKRLSQLWLNDPRTAVGDASIGPAVVLCLMNKI